MMRVIIYRVLPEAYSGEKHMKKILILTSDAGFGHRSAAEALELAVNEAHGDCCTAEIVNPLHDSSIPDLIKMLETGYDDVVVEDPTLYQLAYTASDAPVVASLLQSVTTTVLEQTLTKIVSAHQPDLIVTTYPAFTQAALQATQKAECPAPVDVVVTDLINVHSLWFHQKASLTFAPTGAVYRQALEQGLPKGKVQLTGLPVNPQLARETRSKAELRMALGWEPDLTTVLVVGSSRTRQTAGLTRLLDNSGLALQIAVVSGGDPDIEAELRATAWKGVVHTYGLVRNMPELMHASDFVICKAGGLIISESLACGLPVILYEALPGQETGNVRYVVENGAGAWSPGPIGALTTTYAWMSNNEAGLKKVQAAARHLGKPRAAYEAAKWLQKQIKGG
jgi:1,2-diacylglycerol 3-beta-galactosyltransferase